MAGKSRRATLLVNMDELNWLESMANSRIQPQRKVVRAKILFRYQAGQTISQIAQGVGTCRDTVYQCLNRALARGVQAALEDLPQGHCHKIFEVSVAVGTGNSPRTTVAAVSLGAQVYRHQPAAR